MDSHRYSVGRTDLNTRRFPMANIKVGEVKIVRTSHEISLFAGLGDNNINIYHHKNDHVTVTVNGVDHQFTPEEAEILTIDTGDGRNQIIVTEETAEVQKTVELQETG